jgi:F0F1-type ATP synthase assembly protein I
MKKKEEKNKTSEKKNKRSKWVALSGAGFQMAITIIGSAFIGKKLDDYYLTQKPWFTLGFVLFGIFASLYLLIKQIKNLDT